MAAALNKHSRTTNSIRNATITLFVQVIHFVLSFVIRAVFVRTLGNSYNSINGLFLNLISALSFAELGIGSATTFFLFKPIADGDTNRIRTILAFYKRIYFIIMAVVAVIGLGLLPFIPFFITGDTVIEENIYLVFFLYVANCCISYFLIYKRTWLIANQQSYVVSLIDELVQIVFFGLQIMVLLLWHQYIAYLIIAIGATLSSNLLITFVVSKKYPWLSERLSVEPLEKPKKKEFMKGVFDLTFYKAGAVLLNSTDNICISLIVGTAFVGLTSNYYLLFSSVNVILMAICNSLAASIGSLIAQGDPDVLLDRYKKLHYASFLLFGVCAICLGTLSHGAVAALFGGEYVQSWTIAFALVLSFTLTGFNQTAALFRTSAGLFKEARFVPLAAGIINIGLSVLFGYLWGVFGILIATSVAKVITFTIFDPLFIYRKVFKVSPTGHYVQLALECAAVVGAYFLFHYVYGFVPAAENVGMLFLHAVIVFIAACAFVMLATAWSPSLRFYFGLVGQRVKAVFRRGKNKATGE